MIESRISVSRTALICSSQRLDAPVDQIWFVLHGYAQTAAEFLESFRPLMTENILFVAPEALSRFYRTRRMDEIGASWMTSSERVSEIADYVAYLDGVYTHVMGHQAQPPKVTGILGFSQGCSTASRWVTSGNVQPERLVLWGGAPAVELRDARFQNDLSTCRVDWVTGTRDRFTPPEKLEELLPMMDTASNPIHLTVFEGKHELHSETLSKIIVV